MQYRGHGGGVAREVWLSENDPVSVGGVNVAARRLQEDAEDLVMLTPVGENGGDLVSKLE